MAKWGVLGIVLLLAVAGCGSLRQELEAALNAWIGFPISAYVARYGPPRASYANGPRQRVFQWEGVQETPHLVTRIPTTNAVVVGGVFETVCTVSFTADTTSRRPTLADWFITSWRLEGC